MNVCWVCFGDVCLADSRRFRHRAAPAHLAGEGFLFSVVTLSVPASWWLPPQMSAATVWGMKKHGCHQQGNYLVPVPSPVELSLRSPSGEPVLVEGVYEAYPTQPKVPAAHEREMFPFPPSGEPRNLYAVSRRDIESGVVRPERYAPAEHVGAGWLIVATSGPVAAAAEAGASSEVPSEVADLASSPSSKQQLVHVARTVSGGSTVAVSASDQESALRAATALAHLRASLATGDRANIWVASPAGAKWSVDEVTEQVLEKAYTRHGGVLVVDRADQANDAAANKLLKTLEEPPPGTVIVLAVTDTARLLPTIRGRLSATVRMDPPPRAQRIEAYRQGGLDEQTAEALDRVCGQRFELGLAAVRASAAQAVVEALASPLAPSPSPAAAAARRANALERAAEAMGDSLGDKKETERLLAKVFAERTATLLASRLQAITEGPKDDAQLELSKIRGALSATEQAILEIAGGVPVRRVLVGLATRLSLSGVLQASPLALR